MNILLHINYWYKDIETKFQKPLSRQHASLWLSKNNASQVDFIWMHGK